MSPKELKALKQPAGQDRNVFNSFKRLLGNLPELTNEQLAQLNFECWHEARVRGGVMELADK